MAGYLESLEPHTTVEEVFTGLADLAMGAHAQCAGVMQDRKLRHEGTVPGTGLTIWKLNISNTLGRQPPQPRDVYGANLTHEGHEFVLFTVAKAAEVADRPGNLYFVDGGRGEEFAGDYALTRGYRDRAVIASIAEKGLWHAGLERTDEPFGQSLLNPDQKAVDVNGTDARRLSIVADTIAANVAATFQLGTGEKTGAEIISELHKPVRVE